MTLLIGDFSASATAASTAITAPEPHWLVGLLTGMGGDTLVAIGMGGFIAIYALCWFLREYRAAGASRRSLDGCRKWRER